MSHGQAINDVAQLAHVELLTPNPDRSLWFFTQLLGMQVTEVVGNSAYLRGYEDFYHHTLKVTESRQPGLGHAAWRTASAPALERRVKALKRAAADRGWVEDEPGHGPAFAFETPAGHRMELVWEVEYFKPAPDQITPLRNRPQKRPMTGVPVRRIDHLNLLAPEVPATRDFLIDQLGFRLREQKLMNDGSAVGAWLSVSPLTHEVAVMRDRAPGASHGRLHHVCYWYGYPQHLYDLADLLVENEVPIEFGPGKHGATQAMFLYCIEPGGNRVELFGDSGYMIFDPDWKPITWTDEDLYRSTNWFGAYVPAEFYLYGTPPVDDGKRG